MEKKFLEIFTTSSELGLNLRRIIFLGRREKYLNKEIQSRMITNIRMKDFNNISLSKTKRNKIQVSVPVKVIYEK